MKLVVTLLLVVLPGSVAAQGASNVSFPHARHARLFPTCSGCHAGITTGDAARTFPAPASCSACHDGSIQPRVTWTTPTRGGAGLLAFSHPAHLAKAKDVTCVACHAVADSSQWLNVARAAPERCVSCHTHSASGHLADDNRCATCHRSLTTAVALTDANIRALPKPPSHAVADFVSVHGALARASSASCATCHARQSCERCHVDGAREPLIRALAADARVARIERGVPPVYPTPADHRANQFALTHGRAATANPSRCATCHARPSCETCHIGEGASDVLQRLPDAKDATAPGVQLRLTTSPSSGNGQNAVALAMQAIVQSPSRQRDTLPRRVSMHPVGFAQAHGTVAASGQLQCASCHSQPFCLTCHAGERITRRYHPVNFLATHAPQAYGRETDCTSCHSTEAFCRTCHRQSGLSTRGNTRSTVFHNAQPLWLLQHGRAARQDLNSCATCHQQTYCMQCHSDLGARINPHGPGFDAARLSSKNPQLCLVCHFKNPLGG